MNTTITFLLDDFEINPIKDEVNVLKLKLVEPQSVTSESGESPSISHIVITGLDYLIAREFRIDGVTKKIDYLAKEITITLPEKPSLNKFYSYLHEVGIGSGGWSFER